MSFKSAPPTHMGAKVDVSNRYLYTLNPEHHDKKHNTRTLITSISTAALLAVGGTLLKLRNRNIVNKNAVELVDSTIGLNSIPYKRTAALLKQKFLYPIKAVISGDTKFLQSDKLKSGLILTAPDDKAGKETVNALLKHSDELGISCIDMPLNLKRNNKIKWIYKKLEEAKKFSESTNGGYVLINLGNISDIINLKVSKSQISNIESTLLEINKQKSPGVMWCGWTKEGESLPYHFNKANILTTKIEK